jgi:hypothetical protein
MTACIDFLSPSVHTLLNQPEVWIIFAFAVVVLSRSKVPESVWEAVKKWRRGTVNEQYGNLTNVAGTLDSHELGWSVPAPMLAKLKGYRTKLQPLMDKCNARKASKLETAQRKSLLKEAVNYCLYDVEHWACGVCRDGEITREELHDLAFVLKEERGGYRARLEPTDVVPEVKVRVVDADIVEVVVDQASNENAGPVRNGWPKGVRYVRIIVTADDGKTEILRHDSVTLRNRLRMPDGSHGKLFLLKAAFLKHLDDVPAFSAEPSFTMPFTTEDLAKRNPQPE